jgi:hypothetical protein
VGYPVHGIDLGDGVWRDSSRACFGLQTAWRRWEPDSRFKMEIPVEWALVLDGSLQDFPRVETCAMHAKRGRAMLASLTSLQVR